MPTAQQDPRESTPPRSSRESRREAAHFTPDDPGKVLQARISPAVERGPLVGNAFNRPSQRKQVLDASSHRPRDIGLVSSSLLESRVDSHDHDRPSSALALHPAESTHSSPIRPALRPCRSVDKMHQRQASLQPIPERQRRDLALESNVTPTRPLRLGQRASVGKELHSESSDTDDAAEHDPPGSCGRISRRSSRDVRRSSWTSAKLSSPQGSVDERLLHRKSALSVLSNTHSCSRTCDMTKPSMSNATLHSRIDCSPLDEHTESGSRSQAALLSALLAVGDAEVALRQAREALETAFAHGQAQASSQVPRSRSKPSSSTTNGNSPFRDVLSMPASTSISNTSPDVITQQSQREADHKDPASPQSSAAGSTPRVVKSYESLSSAAVSGQGTSSSVGVVQSCERTQAIEGQFAASVASPTVLARAASLLERRQRERVKAQNAMLERFGMGSTPSAIAEEMENLAPASEQRKTTAERGSAAFHLSSAQVPSLLAIELPKRRPPHAKDAPTREDPDSDSSIYSLGPDSGLATARITEALARAASITRRGQEHQLEARQHERQGADGAEIADGPSLSAASTEDECVMISASLTPRDASDMSPRQSPSRTENRESTCATPSRRHSINVWSPAFNPDESPHQLQGHPSPVFGFELRSGRSSMYSLSALSAHAHANRTSIRLSQNFNGTADSDLGIKRDSKLVAGSATTGSDLGTVPSLKGEKPRQDPLDTVCDARPSSAQAPASSESLVDDDTDEKLSAARADLQFGHSRPSNAILESTEDVEGSIPDESDQSIPDAALFRPHELSQIVEVDEPSKTMSSRLSVTASVTAELSRSFSRSTARNGGKRQLSWTPVSQIEAADSSARCPPPPLELEEAMLRASIEPAWKTPPAWARQDLPWEELRVCYDTAEVAGTVDSMQPAPKVASSHAVPSSAREINAGELGGQDDAPAEHHASKTTPRREPRAVTSLIDTTGPTPECARVLADIMDDSEQAVGAGHSSAIDHSEIVGPASDTCPEGWSISSLSHFAAPTGLNESHAPPSELRRSDASPSRLGAQAKPLLRTRGPELSGAGDTRENSLGLSTSQLVQSHWSSDTSAFNINDSYGGFQLRSDLATLAENGRTSLRLEVSGSERGPGRSSQISSAHTSEGQTRWSQESASDVAPERSESRVDDLHHGRQESTLPRTMPAQDFPGQHGQTKSSLISSILPKGLHAREHGHLQSSSVDSAPPKEPLPKTPTPVKNHRLRKLSHKVSDVALASSRSSSIDTEGGWLRSRPLGVFPQEQRQSAQPLLGASMFGGTSMAKKAAAAMSAQHMMKQHVEGLRECQSASAPVSVSAQRVSSALSVAVLPKSSHAAPVVAPLTHKEPVLRARSSSLQRTDTRHSDTEQLRDDCSTTSGLSLSSRPAREVPPGRSLSNWFARRRPRTSSADLRSSITRLSPTYRTRREDASSTVGGAMAESRMGTLLFFPEPPGRMTPDGYRKDGRELISPCSRASTECQPSRLATAWSTVSGKVRIDLSKSDLALAHRSDRKRFPSSESIAAASMNSFRSVGNLIRSASVQSATASSASTRGPATGSGGETLASLSPRSAEWSNMLHPDKAQKNRGNSTNALRSKVNTKPRSFSLPLENPMSMGLQSLRPHADVRPMSRADSMSSLGPPSSALSPPSGGRMSKAKRTAADRGLTLSPTESNVALLQRVSAAYGCRSTSSTHQEPLRPVGMPANMRDRGGLISPTTCPEQVHSAPLSRPGGAEDVSTLPNGRLVNVGLNALDTAFDSELPAYSRHAEQLPSRRDSPARMSRVYSQPSTPGTFGAHGADFNATFRSQQVAQMAHPRLCSASPHEIVDSPAPLSPDSCRAWLASADV